MKVTILNTSILTSFGSFNYEPISLEQAKELIKNGFESAVGHQTTCDILTSLLEQDVKLNRIQYAQSTEDVALVFKLKGRPEEGKILTVAEIEEIGYEFGLLTKLTAKDDKVDVHSITEQIPKFAIGDNVFCLNNNSVERKRVEGYEITRYKSRYRDSEYIKYFLLEKEDGYTGEYLCVEKFEDEVFLTKEELINSL